MCSLQEYIHHYKAYHQLILPRIFKSSECNGRRIKLCKTLSVILNADLISSTVTDGPRTTEILLLSASETIFLTACSIFLWLVNAWAFKSLRANTENLPALHSRPFSPDGLIRITVFPILWISVLQSAEQRLHTEFTISSLTVRFLTHGCFSIIAPVGQTTAH